MRIGLPKEIKNHEYRVGLVPAGVRELVAHGHSVTVEAGAGLGAGFSDSDYVAAGATIEASAEKIFADAEMIVKVKEPLAVERARLKPDQILFTYLHLAPDPEQTRDLVNSGCIGIAYETVTSPLGDLPLLKPMSEVAGRLAPQVGAHALEREAGGRGVLLGGVPGVPRSRVVVIGGGVSGTHAADVALGLGAEVTVVDRSLEALRRIEARFAGKVATAFSTPEMIAGLVPVADLVIGTVLIPGAAAPKLLTRKMVASMPKGSVFVDVAIDQGGCAETSRPTTHSEPTFVEEGVVHYCVTNMPGAVPRTSTLALTNATLPFALAIANKGWRRALLEDKHLRAGLNVAKGKITCAPVAEAQKLSATSADDLLAA